MLCLLTAFCSTDIFNEQQFFPSQHFNLEVLSQNKGRWHLEGAFTHTGIKLEITLVKSVKQMPKKV